MRRGRGRSVRGVATAQVGALAVGRAGWERVVCWRAQKRILQHPTVCQPLADDMLPLAWHVDGPALAVVTPIPHGRRR